tara:strand:- start:135 stop:377 length:243 start_codon:yes stop_codon:yes gene_type:complete
MSFPIRCFTCGKVIANKYEKFLQYDNKETAFNDLKIERYCCKRMFLTHIDTFNILSPYIHVPNSVTIYNKTAENVINSSK